ncbi:hypothetical protein LCGC14_2202510 [marine sediment metagenome]|uniref:Uncharacterized protein n=1 Tax=marine sediment metagenome TaxID=412755 RepID=A0A0F9DGD7_9ZZZZ
MITRERAEHAQDLLGAKLNRPSWLRGIGLTHDSKRSWSLKVNVQALTDEVKAVVPKMVGDVPVSVEVVGDIVAQS